MKKCCEKCARGKPCKGTKKMPKIGKGMRVKRGQQSRMRKKAGGSNVGKYKTVSKGDFCGPSGGAPSGAYPVNTKKRARAALSYARNAPNPEGIRRCVKRKWPSVGKSTKKK